MKRKSLQTTIGILLIVAILVLINLIANTQFARLDLTEGKIFSLADASKETVANLEEPLTVKVFASENLSPQLNDVKRYLNDLLSDYRAYGEGDFHYEFIDPGTDEALQQEAAEYRIPPFQENVWNQDKLELKRVYLGAVFLYEDKQETIPTIQSTSGLEYNITSLIKRLTSQQDRKVGFLTGHGEPSHNEAMAQLTNLLGGNYEVQAVDIGTVEQVPSDLDALLIVSPSEQIDPMSRLKVDQYIMRGGNVGWFLSPVKTDLQRGQASDLRHRTDRWTKHYGFRINNDLVADLDASMINIQERRGWFTVQNTVKYPFFPNVTEFDEDHPIVRDLDLISLFFPSSIDTSHWREAGVSLEPLMFSGKQSLVQTGRYSINATQEWDPANFERSGIVLGASLHGPFSSAFTEGDTTINMDEPFAYSGEWLTESPESARMVVVGNGNFIQDGYLSTPANLFFALNTVDWLVGDTDLINLRTREVSIRPLKEISAAEKQAWKYVNWFGPPLLIVIMGIIYWQVRRNRRYGS